jgi:hypothetical protein
MYDTEAEKATSIHIGTEQKMSGVISNPEELRNFAEMMSPATHDAYMIKEMLMDGTRPKVTLGKSYETIPDMTITFKQGDFTDPCAIIQTSPYRIDMYTQRGCDDYQIADPATGFSVTIPGNHEKVVTLGKDDQSRSLVAAVANGTAEIKRIPSKAVSMHEFDVKVDDVVADLYQAAIEAAVSEVKISGQYAHVSDERMLLSAGVPEEYIDKRADAYDAAHFNSREVIQSNNVIGVIRDYANDLVPHLMAAEVELMQKACPEIKFPDVKNYDSVSLVSVECSGVQAQRMTDALDRMKNDPQAVKRLYEQAEESRQEAATLEQSEER